MARTLRMCAAAPMDLAARITYVRPRENANEIFMPGTYWFGESGGGCDRRNKPPVLLCICTYMLLIRGLCVCVCECEELSFLPFFSPCRKCCGEWKAVMMDEVMGMSGEVRSMFGWGGRRENGGFFLKRGVDGEYLIDGEWMGVAG